MLAYQDESRNRREFIESKWDELRSKNTSSSFDNHIWNTEDGKYWCFNANKYTLSQAVEIVMPNIIKTTKERYGEFDHVGKSFARHRCGTWEDGPTCGWWCGDDEFGYHAVPVWMFSWDDEYDSIEEALKKEQKNG